MAVQRRRGFLRRSLQAGGATLSALALLGRRRAEGQAGMVSGFDHVAAPMRSTEAMLRFYRDLGFQVKEGERICSVHFGDHKINFHRPALWQDEQFTLRAPAAQPPCGDFCFVWDGTESALAETLVRAGAEVVTGPVPRTGGRSGGTAQGTSRYTRDPDGNLLEFIVY
ncbi:MAG: VOC family protein [Bryobacterales bacterium]|nr:VOC family protein [Bryobacterales bacterium]